MAVATSPAARAKLTPAERLARANRAQQLQTGAVHIPLACPRCSSTSLDNDRHLGIQCLQCGHNTTEMHTHTDRRRRIGRFLRTGVR